HVAKRRDRVLIAICRVHPPAEVGAIGNRKEGRLPPPLTAAECPGGPKEVEREARIHDRPQRQLDREGKPGCGGGHGGNIERKSRYILRVTERPLIHSSPPAGPTE